ncbi:hypothetical protein [Chitinimonas koreensis]|uniref:hypothetical protein n=1 Tax=Chitinimonas koreensis TaxID=356302 RepID=UPI0012F826F6|nr:hypothetical protein [Chitinimonas koreensis]QNM95353.1 hypothetical protein H9L41_15950 [Chitinimonas koreensis]
MDPHPAQRFLVIPLFPRHRPIAGVDYAGKTIPEDGASAALFLKNIDGDLSNNQ